MSVQSTVQSLSIADGPVLGNVTLLRFVGGMNRGELAVDVKQPIAPGDYFMVCDFVLQATSYAANDVSAQHGAPWLGFDVHLRGLKELQEGPSCRKALTMFAERFPKCNDRSIRWVQGELSSMVSVYVRADVDKPYARLNPRPVTSGPIASPAHAFDFSITFPDSDWHPGAPMPVGWHLLREWSGTGVRYTRRCTVSAEQYISCGKTPDMPTCFCEVPLAGFVGIGEVEVSVQRLLHGRSAVTHLPRLNENDRNAAYSDSLQAMDDAGNLIAVIRDYFGPRKCGALQATCPGPWHSDFDCDGAELDMASSLVGYAPPEDVALGIEFEFSVRAPEGGTVGLRALASVEEAIALVKSKLVDESLSPNWNVFEESVKGGPADVGLEVTSPAPPYALHGAEGVRQIAHVARLMQLFGVSAPSVTGLHVHVNVLKKNALPDGARVLEPRQVAAVVINWIRWQLVISSLTPPSRRWNTYAVPMLRRLPGTRRMFEAAFAAIHSPSSVTCDSRHCTIEGALEHLIHLGKKGQTLNLLKLTSYGTLEVRQQHGTYRQEDAVAWAAFVADFVHGMSDVQSVSEFVSGTAVEGWRALSSSQRKLQGITGRQALISSLGLRDTILGTYLSKGGMGACA